MLFDDVLIQNLESAAKTNPYLAQSLDEFTKDCKRLADEGLSEKFPLARERQWEAQLFSGQALMKYGDICRTMVEDAVKLSFWMRLQPGEAEAFDRIREVVRMVCDLPDWVFQGKLGNPFDADLWTADVAMHLSVVYDTCRELWSPEERQMIESAIMEKGVKPIYREWVSFDGHRHALDSMGHNWWSVIVAGGCTAIALLGEGENRRQMLAQMLWGLQEWFAYPGNVLQNKSGNFGDGDFIEFLGYLAYALSNSSIYERCCGTRLFPEKEMEKLVDYYMVHFQVLEEGVRMVNFGDSPFIMKNPPYFLLSLAGRFEREDLLSFVVQMCPRLKTPYDFLFYPTRLTLPAKPVVKAPVKAVYPHAGYAVVRSGYEKSDFLFAVKTGESWNHNHRDVGSFVFSACGKEIVVDSGTCTYGLAEHHGYYTAPEGHNVVLFNGKGQHPDALYCGTKFPGSFPAFLDAGDFTYLLADCTGPYAGLFQRFYRHLLFLDGVVLLIDDLHTYEEGELSWLLHPSGKAAPTDEGFLLEDGNTRLLCLSPAETVFLEQGYYAEDRVLSKSGSLTKSEYLRLSSQTKDRRSKLLHALVPPLPQNKGLTVGLRDDKVVIELTLRRKNTVERILLNRDADGRVMHKNSNVVFEDVETDAFIVYQKEDENGILLAAGMINGGKLKIGDRFFASSLLKQDFLYDLEQRVLQASVSSDTRLFTRIQETEGLFPLKKGANHFSGV